MSRRSNDFSHQLCTSSAKKMYCVRRGLDLGNNKLSQSMQLLATCTRLFFCRCVSRRLQQPSATAAAFSSFSLLVRQHRSITLVSLFLFRGTESHETCATTANGKPSSVQLSQEMRGLQSSKRKRLLSRIYLLELLGG